MTLIETLVTVFTAITSFLIGYIPLRRKAINADKEASKSFVAGELEKYRAGYEALRLELEQLKLSLIVSPTPEWKKDASRRYVQVNNSYVMNFLFPLGIRGQDILGKTDDEVFGRWPNFVETLRELEDAAQKNIGHVAAKRGVKFPGNPEKMTVIKEIAQKYNEELYYIGSCYDDRLFDK